MCTVLPLIVGRCEVLYNESSLAPLRKFEINESQGAGDSEYICVVHIWLTQTIQGGADSVKHMGGVGEQEQSTRPHTPTHPHTHGVYSFNISCGLSAAGW